MAAPQIAPVTAGAPPPLSFSTWIAGILRRRRLILRFVLGMIALALLAAFLLPPVYRSRASFVTNVQGSKLGGALSGGGVLGGLTSQLGLGSLSDPSESPDFYAQLIRSDELRRRLALSKFPNPKTENPRDSALLIDLMGIREEDRARQLEIAIQLIGNMVKVETDEKTNLVAVTADARWPELAAALATRTVELVNAFNREQRVSRARSKRQFLETRLNTAYDELRASEGIQRRFYDQNRQWRNSPALVFEEGRIRRNADIAGDLYLTLRQQFELARLDEFNDAALITPVDPAVVPRKKHWPRGGILLVSATIVGAILGVLTAGALVILDDWRRRNPEAAGFLRDSLPARIRRSRRKRAAGSAAVAS